MEIRASVLHLAGIAALVGCGATVEVADTPDAAKPVVASDAAVDAPQVDAAQVDAGLEAAPDADLDAAEAARDVVDESRHWDGPIGCVPDADSSRYVALVGDEVFTARVTGPGALAAATRQPRYPVPPNGQDNTSQRQGVATVGECAFGVGGGYMGYDGPDYKWIATAETYSSRMACGLMYDWSKLSPLPVAIDTGTLIEDSGYLLFLSDSGVYQTSIQAGCSIGAWSLQSATPVTRTASAVLKAGGFVYVIGGDASPSTATADVTFAPVSGGVIGQWQPTTPLPEPRHWEHATTDGTFVYVLGGFMVTDTLISAKIHSDGTLDPWSPPITLPGNGYSETGTVVDGYLYVFEENGAHTWSAPLTDGVAGTFTDITSTVAAFYSDTQKAHLLSF
jgi:hypothetical protein